MRYKVIKSDNERFYQMRLLFAILLIFSCFGSYAQQLNEEEKQLALIINQYRQSRKLPPLKISKSLTTVAKAHTSDLDLHGNKIKKGCNMHSWSKYGNWKPVDYYEDHRNGHLMWSKPSELTSYKGEGYEIIYWHSDKATSKEALKEWKTSPGHNSVIIESGIWKKVNFICMGISIDKNYAAVWFGVKEDPEGYLKLD